MQYPFIMPPHIATYRSNSDVRKPMSLIVALAGENEIVMASDTICMAGDADGTYQYSERYSKIRVLGDKRFAVGIAGNTFGEFPFRAGGIRQHGSFSEIVEEFVGKTRTEYDKGNRKFNFDYIFCGFDESGPRIETMRFFQSPHDGSPQNDGLTSSKFGRNAVGVNKHGALYWIWTFHKTSLPLETIKLLACFTLRETIRHDGRVREPLEMLVVRPDKAVEFLLDSEVKHIEAKYEQKRERIEHLLYEERDTPPPSQESPVASNAPQQRANEPPSDR
jgi:20S proteasome alpha/beta subunit